MQHAGSGGLGSVRVQVFHPVSSAIAKKSLYPGYLCSAGGKNHLIFSVKLKQLAIPNIYILALSDILIWSKRRSSSWFWAISSDLLKNAGELTIIIPVLTIQERGMLAIAAAALAFVPNSRLEASRITTLSRVDSPANSEEGSQGLLSTLTKNVSDFGQSQWAKELREEGFFFF